MKHDILPRMRVQILRDLHYSQSIVAKMLQKPRSFVERWWTRSDLSDSKIPRKITRSVAAQIVKRISFKKQTSTRVVARQMKLSQSTIWKTAKKMKLRPYHQTRAPIPTDKHRILRLKFAKVNANKDWSRVLFIDEKKIELFPKPN